jgi:DNA-binding CsgD family transcriptional regulator
VTLRRNAICAAMSLLTERERDIFTARRLRDPSLTFAELAQRYNISRKRVRQIEAAALKKDAIGGDACRLCNLAGNSIAVSAAPPCGAPR